MNKLILASFLSTSMVVPSSWMTPSSIPPQTIRSVEQSIVRINHPVMGIDFNTGLPITLFATCTGFVIGHTQEDGETFSTILTANHCIPEPDEDGVYTLTADVYWPAQVVKTDKANDLALISTQLERPALKAGNMPVRGQSVYSFGYGYGLDTYLFIAHIIVAPLAVLAEEYPQGVLVSPSYVPGMSGGPVVDTKGRVVSIVQAGTQHGIGYGVSISVIKLFVGDFWQAN